MTQPILLASGGDATYTVTLPSGINTLVNNISSNLGLSLINNIITLMLFIAVLLAFGFIIYGGIKWTISQGDPKNIESARNTIIYSAIGLFVAALAILVVNILGYFFNVPLIK